ncbi:MAG: TetR/AcrR family transcriptional regulator [Anaerolineaceae bacterium]|nr:TetR/AcrR family transcriptional regulator [Anaerolineaceae bacterium]
MEIELLFPIIDRLRLQMPLNDITMDILAAKSGISRASIYRNFGSKQQIITTYLRKNGEIALNATLPSIPQRITSAAETIFLTHGFASSTIEMVAEEADLGTATIYRYFETKENLILQVLRNLSPSDKNIFAVVDDGMDIEVALPKFIQAGLDFMRANRQLFKLLLFESEYLDPINLQVARIQERTRDRLVTFFTNHIPNGPYQHQHAQNLTVSFIGLLFGFAFSNVMLEEFEIQDDITVQWISDMMIKKIGELSV